MTALELKAQLQKDIENERNNSILEKVQAYYHKLKAMPCQYSVGELKDRLRKGREAAKAGVYKTQDEIRSKHTTPSNYKLK